MGSRPRLSDGRGEAAGPNPGAPSQIPRDSPAFSGRPGRVVRHHPARLPVPASITSVVDAPRLVSSDASPTLPRVGGHCSMPAALAAAWNCSPTIFGESGTTRAAGAGFAAALSVRIARATPPFTNRTPLTSPSWFVLLRRTVTSTPSPSAASATSAQRSALTSLRRIPAAMKRSPAITASRRPRSSRRPDRSAASADTRPALCRAPLTTSPVADRPGKPPHPRLVGEGQTRRPPPISRPQRHRADGSGGPLHGHRGLRPGNDHPGPRVPELTASTSRPSESRGPWTNGRHPPPDSDSVTAVPRPRPLARPHGVKLSAAGVEAPRLLRATLRRGQTVRRPRRTVVRSELRLGAVQVSTHRAPGSSS